MITRIEICNFMSHEHTVIEPAPGLTVLVGPNNCGKSAVVAALQIVCHNENSTYVLRHGERECTVKIQTDDGHTVEWRRKNSPSYVIDGQTFDRLRGSGLPDELHRALRLPRIDAGSETDFDVHFGTQKAPIFLLAGSAANAARFFASSSDAIRLVQMQKRHKEKLADAQREKNRAEAESKQVNAELEALEPVVDLDRRLTKAADEYDQIMRCVVLIEQAEKLESAIHRQSFILAHYSDQTGAVRPLRSPPEMVPTEPLEELSAAIDAMESRATAAASRTSAMAALRPLPEMAATEPLQALMAAIESEQCRLDAATFRTGALATLESPPELFDVASLAEFTASIAQLCDWAERGEAERRSLAQLPYPPQLDDTDALDRLVDRLANSTGELANAERRCASLRAVAQPPVLANESDLAAVLAAVTRTVSQIEQLEATRAAVASALPVPIATPTDDIAQLLVRFEQSSAQVGNWGVALKTVQGELAEAGTLLRAEAEGKLCPVCGSLLDADRVLAQAVAGTGGHTHG